MWYALRQPHRCRGHPSGRPATLAGLSFRRRFSPRNLLFPAVEAPDFSQGSGAFKRRDERHAQKKRALALVSLGGRSFSSDIKQPSHWALAPEEAFVVRAQRAAPL